MDMSLLVLLIAYHACSKSGKLAEVCENEPGETAWSALLMLMV